MRINSKFITAVAIILIGVLIITGRKSFVKPNRQVEILKTSFRAINQLPDPAMIDTAGKWYLLNHISTPLIEFDLKNTSLLPMIAKSWKIRDNKYILTLDPKAKFSDGTSIRARDVVASIKRIVIKKSSLHFPLWKHVADCENLKFMSDPCQGISGDDDSGVVEVTLKAKSESFLLQISSPEGGIWFADDIDANTLDLKPSKFSGPYSLKNLTVNENKDLILIRNPYSLIQKTFPDSPKEIWIRSMPRAEIEKSIAEGNSDVFIGDYIPFNEYDWDKMDVGVHYSTPSSVNYFYNLNSKKKMGMDLLSELAKFSDKHINFAQTVLPITPSIALSKSEIETLLPKKSDPVISIAAPSFYYKDGTLDFIKEAAAKVGIKVEITKLDMAEFFELRNVDENYKSKYDFLFSNYVASERYPAVQLRFITGNRKAAVDLNDIESPDQDQNKISRLKEYQRWLISSQLVVPFYFTRSHIVYSNKLDIGSQPLTDAEIQLWRITKKVD